MPRFFLHTFAWSSLMIRNYLKIAVRSLLKHKSFSGINIFGLSASMAVCLLIILFIQDQKSYDSFHEQANRVYRVVADAVDPDSNVIAVSATPAPLAGVLERDMPGIEAAVRLRPLRTLATHEGKTLPVEGFFADASFFEVFSFPLAVGDPRLVLAEPNTIVLSRKLAETFFGAQNPIGQILTFDQGGDFVVTGILDPFPGKSHLKFEALASFSSLQGWEDEREVLADWHVFYRYYTYVLLEDKQAATALAAGLPAIVKQQYPAREQSYYRFELQPLTSINLGAARNNEIGFILPGLVAYFLAGLALIIMLTACFNYVGMSVARSLSRAREVGIRKVVGAHRGQLMRQFVSEAVVVALLALVVACGLLFVLVPVFNSLWFVQMSQTQIALDWGDASLYVVLLVFSIVVGIVAGLYPAVYLSRFAPAHVLKGGAGGQGVGGLRLRKVLVASQFAFSLVFMVTMVALYQQLQLMIHADYGFDDERVVNVAMPGVTYETLREALLTDPSITKVSATSKLPASGSVNGVWVHLEERAEPLRGYEYAIDEHFIDNLGLRLVAGRNFSSAFAADSVQSVIINETAVQDFGYGTPEAALGHTLRMEDGPPVEVVGVVKDYHFNLLVDAIKPMLLHYDPQAFRYANLRVQPGEMERALAHLEATWQQLNVAYPLDYEIFSDQLASNPINVVFRDFIRIIGLVAGLAVIIACLGLFGMAAYSAQVRVKEVGIRKVLGASVADVVGLLSKDYIKLVGLATLIAVPLAWGLNNLWLQQFARRIDFGVGVLLVTTGALLALAFLTIASQTIRAALMNPVDTLRAEG